MIFKKSYTSPVESNRLEGGWPGGARPQNGRPVGGGRGLEAGRPGPERGKSLEGEGAENCWGLPRERNREEKEH